MGGYGEKVCLLSYTDNMNRPKFSIITPSYNTDINYLKETYSSLINQTFAEWEWLFIDDCSTNGSDEFIKNLNDNRVRYICNNKNSGPLYSRINGIKNASGDYCVFLDADDMLESNALQTMKENLDSKTEVLIYSFAYYNSANDKSKKFHQLYEYGRVFNGDKTELYEKFISGYDLNSIWTKCIKTELIKSDNTDYSPYYDKRMSEDLLQSIWAITKAESIKYIYEPLYLYRQVYTGLSKSWDISEIKKKSTAYLYGIFLSYLKQWDMDYECYRRILAKTYCNFMPYYFIKFYENSNKNQKKQILKFDWLSLFPSEIRENPQDYLSGAYRDIFIWWKNGEYGKIKLFFFKRSIYEKYKKVKSCLKNQLNLF